MIAPAEANEFGGKIRGEVAGVMARTTDARAASGRFHLARHWPVRVFRLFRSYKKDRHKYFTERPPF
jgi:hypothetical protein